MGEMDYQSVKDIKEKVEKLNESYDYLIEHNEKFIKAIKNYYTELNKELPEAMEEQIKAAKKQIEELIKLRDLDNEILKKKLGWIPIGSIVKCTNRATAAGCKMVGEKEDIGQYGIIVGHDSTNGFEGREYYRIYFTEYSRFIGVEEKYVEETDFTSPELEAKRELVLNNIKEGNVCPFVLYGKVLTKEVLNRYNKNKGWLDLDEDDEVVRRHDFSFEEGKIKELLDWLQGQKYLVDEHSDTMTEEYEQAHKWELSRNCMINKTVAKIKEIFK